jgi:hypothetical protein
MTIGRRPVASPSRSGLDDALFEALAEHYQRAAAPITAVVIEQLGGAIARPGADATAFAHRDAPFSLLLVSRWTDPAASDRHIAWTRGLWQAAQPHAAGGTYINYLSAGEDDAAIWAAYGPSYERLAALKNRYDPTNFFRSNHNVPPSQQA